MTYEPGTVAEVTYLEKRCRAMRTGTPKHMGWEVVRGDGTKTWCSDTSCYVTDVRPLVVLDPSDRALIIRDWCPSGAHREGLLDLLREHHWSHLADQIEAQTKPPRIPEPGLWGVVEAGTASTPMVRRWVRYGTGWRDAFGGHAEWSDILDPTLIREGVES